MGGAIGVESTPGEGSTFWFTVPVKAAKTRKDVVERADLKGIRVLAVDDNQTNLAILERQLTRAGLLCRTTSHPDAVLGLLDSAARANEPYDLALIDARMPQTSGIELTRAIRATPELASLPVVMLTSSGNGRSRAVDAGVDGFVTKPIHRDRLLQEIARGLEPRASDAQPESPSPAFTANTGAPAAAAPADGPRLLVADDNLINQRVAVALLEKRGYRVEVAGNGREAVRMSETTGYEAILMDCQMPELDGYQATAEIRRREGGERRIPIIAMTANTMAGDRERCLEAGMDDYIAKPIRLEELDDVLDRLRAGRVTPRGVTA